VRRLLPRRPRARQAPSAGTTAAPLDLLRLPLARFERLSFVIRQPATRGLGGEHASRRRAPSTDFVDYRAYAPGDDPRRVDWNVYGRLGSLQVKLTEARERLDLVLALDVSASMGWGNPDKLLFAEQAVAALAYVGLARFDTVRVVPHGQGTGRRSLGPIHGRSRFGEVARFLADISLATSPAPGPSLRDQVAECLPGIANGTLVVLVSDLLDPLGCGAALDAVVGRGADVVVVHVVAPQELDPEPELLGELELVDAETGETVNVGVSLSGREQYRERYGAWAREQAAQCAARGLRYVRVRTDTSIDALLLDALRRGRVLR